MSALDVIMGVYNGGSFLNAALSSICEQLGHGMRLLIMDDGSTDGSRSVLEQIAARNPRVVLYHQANGGLASALNRLIAESTAPLIARMDADDISLPHRLAVQVSYMNANPNVAFAGAWSILKRPGCTDAACQCYPNDDTWLRRQLQAGRNVFVHSSVIMRRSALTELDGPYRFRLIQDYDLWLRLLERHKIGMVENICHVSYLHDSRISGQRYAMRRRLHDAILALHRERLSGNPESRLPADIQADIFGDRHSSSSRDIDSDWYSAMTAVTLRDFALARLRFGAIAASRRGMWRKALKWWCALSMPGSSFLLPRLYEPLKFVGPLARFASREDAAAIQEYLATHERFATESQTTGRHSPWA